MTTEEQIQYLANIYHLARADGRVEVREDRVVEGMAAGIGAGYLETRNALDMSFEKDFRIVFPGRLSDRMRNLEDMLCLAYSYKGLGDLEKRVIVDFARQIGVTQEQVDVIRTEAKARASEGGKKS